MEDNTQPRGKLSALSFDSPPKRIVNESVHDRKVDISTVTYTNK